MFCIHHRIFWTFFKKHIILRMLKFGFLLSFGVLKSKFISNFPIQISKKQLLCSFCKLLEKPSKFAICMGDTLACYFVSVPQITKQKYRLICSTLEITLVNPFWVEICTDGTLSNQNFQILRTNFSFPLQILNKSVIRFILHWNLLHKIFISPLPSPLG
jgi:hypothetical protein